jgi:trehalose 6-phosphate synthase
MRQVVRFAVLLILGLSLVAIVASIVVRRTARGWFEHDLTLRAELVVNGSRRRLIQPWRERHAEAILPVLSEMTSEARLLGAAACDKTGTLLARTPSYPAQFTCHDIAAHVRPPASKPRGQWTEWTRVLSLPSGDVHVSAIPLLDVDADEPLGFIVLAHDLNFAAQRVAWTRGFFLASFGVTGFAASLMALLATRVSLRKWREQLRRWSHGAASGQIREFQPIVGDLRDLVDRLVAEKDSDREAGPWTAERLKQTLNRYLSGEQVVILANREPYLHVRQESGEITVFHPASGLVTALEPVMRACSGIWVAHGAGSADRETSDRHDRVRVPPGEESYLLRRVWLSEEEEKGYYYGFSNEGIWPLCHIAYARPIFRSEDWETYRKVNQKFADAVCDEVSTKDPVVLVQDYHFALVPRMIRERLPRATVIAFWHIPWPNAEQFGICPWEQELLEGMLGASILGFHTQFHCNNFLDSVDRFLEARIDREQNAVVQQGRSTLVRAYPISVEWPVRWLAEAPSVAECRRQVFEELGLPQDALLGLGVDRLDYTKGIEERLSAVEQLLERFPAFRGRFTFVQLAAPSRSVIQRYQELDRSVTETARRINERFGEGDYRPIIFKRAHHEPPTVFRYYRAADVCYVSSLHDGMNLVAKEFVAARDDHRGVLVLSRFTGAARELPEALVVNPYDLDEASSALAAALQMPAAEQAERMRAMRAFIADYNVYRWAGRMLVDAGQLRRRNQLSRRLRHQASTMTLARQ